MASNPSKSASQSIGMSATCTSHTPDTASSKGDAQLKSAGGNNNNTESTATATAKSSRKKKGSRVLPPVVVDAATVAALSQAAPLLSDLGFYGVAGCLVSASTQILRQTQPLAQVLSTSNVVSSVQKTLQDSPPWIHWSKIDCAPELVIQPPDKRQILKSTKGYRMGRATVGASPAQQAGHFLLCQYYELVLLEGPSAKEIHDSLPPNARLGPGLEAQLERALRASERREFANSRKRQRREQSAAPHGAAAADKDDGAHSDDDSESDVDDSELRVGGHVRVGWSMRTGDLQAPVGYDQWSYGIRSLDGSLLHRSQRLDAWGGEGYEPGDVIGCAILLDEQTPLNNHIRFFKNGYSLGDILLIKGKRAGGEAFSEITSGTYYPAASGYLGGSVRANFGPHWICPPRKMPAGIRLAPLTAPTIPSNITNNPKVAAILKLFKDTSKQQLMAAALETEAKLLAEACDKFRREHVEFIRQERLQRNLAVQDLPHSPSE